MSSDDFSWDSLGKYLRDEGTAEEKKRWEESDREWEKKKEEFAVKDMQRKRRGEVFGDDDMSLDTQPPKPRDLSDAELKPPQPHRSGSVHPWWRKLGEKED